MVILLTGKKRLKRVMDILGDSDETELIVYTMTLVNKVSVILTAAAAAADDDDYYYYYCCYYYSYTVFQCSYDGSTIGFSKKKIPRLLV